MQAHEVHKKGADVFTRHDIEAFADLYAADAVVNDPGYPEPLKGREAVKKDMAVFVTAFPDIQVRVVNSIAAGNNMIAAEWVMTGTNRGPIETPTGTIPATNKRIELRVGTFERLNGEGRIVEESRYYDQAGLFAQLGVSP
ncbi:MAG: ester cyclase [Dongiaceae bacterium]